MFFLFVIAIILLLVTTIVINILCKYKKLKTLVASLAFQQIKEEGAIATQEPSQYIECTCKIQWYTMLMLVVSILGLILFVIIKSRKLKLFRGHLFSNAVKIMLFILDKNATYPQNCAKWQEAFIHSNL